MKHIFSFLLLTVSCFTFAQNEIDALRYSFIKHGGTARYTAMSGAFGALGSDFSSLSTNPAGIATFKKSVKFMISPGFSTKTATAEYKNEKTENESLGLSLNNIGLVVAINPYNLEKTDWKNICFGIGFNKFLNLNEHVTIKGYSEESSMLDQFAMNSNGYIPEELYEQEYLAFAAELIDVVEESTDNTYWHQYLNETYLNQEKKYNNKGGVSEFVFSVGGNYADKLQVGASVGIQIVRYINSSKYTESSEYTDLASYTFGEELQTIGAGFNLKLGLIYIPVRFIRLGAAIHTPTIYQLTDVYSYSMKSHWRTPDDDGETDYSYDTGNYNDDGTTENEFTYEMFTPYRFIASAAFIVSKFAIFSADYEHVNYSKARLRAMEDNFDNQNENIKNLYKPAGNIRLGTEVRLAPIYLRGGVSHYGSPYSKDFNAKGAINSYSFGIGLKTNKLYLDFAFEHSAYSKDYKMFDYINFLPDDKTEVASEIANLSFRQNTINVTLGFRL